MVRFFLVAALACMRVHASNPISCTHNGITLSLQGTEDVDYAFEQLYHDAAVDEHGILYLTSATKIVLAHNDSNSISQGTSGGREIIGGDQGKIRYRIDYDLNWGLSWTGSNPAYTGPMAIADLTYAPLSPAVKVLGSTGPRPGVAMTDMENFYWRGILDKFGDEWHVLGIGDDDSWRGLTGSNTEQAASDGWTYNIIVDPKTPVIWLETEDAAAEYFTTGPKAYFIPNIAEQTSYVTDGVTINLGNITTADDIYYRFGSGSFVKYTGPLSTTPLADGEHVLEFYYNDAYHKTRTIVKNPGYPSDNDHFTDGTGHGYLLWRDDAEKARIIERLSADSDVTEIYLRDRFSSGPMNKAVTAALFGYDTYETRCAEAKAALMASQLFLDRQGHEQRIGQRPLPCKNLHSYGYYCVNKVFNAAITYDMLITEYRAPAYTGGFTAIEDHKIREALAGEANKWMWHNMWGEASSHVGTVDYRGYAGMWSTSMSIGGMICAMAIPSYDSPLYGTSGFDGTPATHAWTPYPDYPESWKDVFITYTDMGNPAHKARLHDHPNRRRLWNWHSGGQIMDDAVWSDRVGYFGINLVGHCMHWYANVVKRRFDLTIPNLEAALDKYNKGTLYAKKDQTYCQGPLPAMINEYFPNLAGEAKANIDNCLFTKSGSCNTFRYYTWYNMANIPNYLWINFNWQTDTPTPLTGVEDKPVFTAVPPRFANPVPSLFTNTLDQAIAVLDTKGNPVAEMAPQDKVHLRSGMYIFQTEDGTAGKMVVGR